MRGSHRVTGISIAVFAIIFNLVASWETGHSSESSSGQNYGSYGPQIQHTAWYGPQDPYGPANGGDSGYYDGGDGAFYGREPYPPVQKPRYGPDYYSEEYSDPYSPYPAGPDPYPAGPAPNPRDIPDPTADGRGRYPGDGYGKYPDNKPAKAYPRPSPADPYPNPKPVKPYPYPQPKSAGPYPHPKPVDPYPAPKPVDPYPQPKHADPYPAPKPVDPYPAPKPVDPYPAYRPVDPYPAYRPVDPYPAPKPVDPYPAHKPVDPYPAPKPVDPYPAPKPVDPYPAPKPVDPYPAPNPYPNHPYDNQGFPNKPVKPAPKPSLPSSLCDNCQFKNGVGYNPFPESCQAYVTCQKHGGYSLIPTKMHCPYNLFWSQKLLTCVRPGETKCPYDPCKASKGGDTVPVYGNCAAYHVCDKYRYTAQIHCCAYGYRYQAGYGYNKPGYQPCVRDPSCRDTCAPKKTPIKKEPCRLFPVRGAITKYQELVHGKYIVRYCAPGTGFVQKDCGCTAKVKIAHKEGCYPEVFIDFKYGIRDVSSNFISVGNEWNRVKSVKAAGAKDGYAGEFYNGQLILWRFSNAPLGPPLKMNFVFLEKAYKKGGYGGKNEILVSNGDCGKAASVSVTFDRSSQTVTALVDTKSTYGKGYKPVYVSVPYAAGEYKEVHYQYDGKYLTLEVNSKSSQKRKSVAASGDVQVRHCALSIGGVKGATPFYGIIDDFKLFLCAPKVVNPYPQPPYASNPNVPDYYPPKTVDPYPAPRQGRYPAPRRERYPAPPQESYPALRQDSYPPPRKESYPAPGPVRRDPYPRQLY